MSHDRTKEVPDAAPGGAGRFLPRLVYPRLTPWAKGRRPLRGLLFAGLCLGRYAFRLLPSAFCLLLTAYCLLPTVLSAQGCAMCYNSASAAKAGAQEALANGVLILLVPPMVFFAMITVVVYMYRNKFRETSVVSGGELPIDDFRLPIDGIDDCRLAIEGIEDCQPAIDNRQS